MFSKRTFFKSVLAATMSTLVMNMAYAADITGAGSTFVYPMLSKWSEVYKKESGTGVNYQSIGSSGGVRQIRAKTVDFGASDAPVSGPDLDKDGMVQFPVVIGGTVPVFNLEGFKSGDLRISGPVLAEMFMGKISKWNDPKILALNPGKKLPDEIITVVHRADGSGTTYNWTDYLTTVSKDWESTVGRGNAVKWPAPTSIGGKGNEGVAANVTRLKGALGYVEYAYVKKNNIPYMALLNKDGKYVEPDDKTFAAAAEGVDWNSKPGMGVSMVDSKGANSWPVTTAVFVLLYKQPADKSKTQEVLKYFDWAWKNGKKLAIDLDYVPLPDNLTAEIRNKVWTQIQK